MRHSSAVGMNAQQVVLACLGLESRHERVRNAQHGATVTITLFSVSGLMEPVKGGLGERGTTGTLALTLTAPWSIVPE